MPLLHDILQRVTDALYKCTLQCIFAVNLRILIPTIISWNSPMGYLPIPFLSGQLTLQLGFEQKQRWMKILNCTSFKVVIPEHVLKRTWTRRMSLDWCGARGPSKFICRWWSENLTTFFFCILPGWQHRSNRVVSAQIYQNAVTWWRKIFFCRKQFGQSCSAMQRPHLFLCV